MRLTHLSLFSGIGGLDLAAEWAGFETIGQVEWADYPTKVLEEHWPDIPRWRDIRDVTGQSIREVYNGQITVVSGGFPCQPFSLAGKQKGKEDNRYLWPEMCRVISEVRPAWVIGENVRGIIRIAADTVCEDLESIGYTVQPFVIPAVGVGAPHKRERVFFIAYANESGQKKRDLPTLAEGQGFPDWSCYENVADAREQPDAQTNSSIGPEREMGNTRDYVGWSHWTSIPEPDWTVSKSELGRVAHGISAGLDALGSLGNAVVPQQVYPIFEKIALIERMMNG